MNGPVSDCLHPILLNVSSKDEPEKEYGLTVPCGHCINCTKKRRREWTLRNILESQYYAPEDIAFVTFTYRDEDLPLFIKSVRPPFDATKSLMPPDMKNFMKRLRRKVPYQIRMFYVGEYGDKFGRPHYHAILYGLRRKDWNLVDEKWQHGFVLVKPWFQETCGYVAGYVQKKLFGDDVYLGQIPPFLRASQRPSIGERYFWDNVETICKQGFIVYDGYKYTIPRIFQRKAYEAGYLPKPDLDEIQLIQNDRTVSWLEKMKAQGVDSSTYLKNFAILSENEFKRMNVTRNCSEVF